MSEYGAGIFIGFAACAPKLMPEWLYRRVLCPPIPEHDGIAVRAPCGTRKIEAALLEKGFDVTVAHPEHLRKIIGGETKAVGITANDPLGLGPASSTFSGLVGKETYSAIFFRKLLASVNSNNNGRLKVIAGGPGAWQLADGRITAKLGIDCVVVGEGEITAVKMFERAINGEELPRVVEGEVVPLDQIPSIKNPAICGLVEIARGCGRGCKFCIPTLLNYRCIPVQKIVEEVKINLDGGAHEILLHAEDVLRYGAKGPIPNGGKVLKLFEEVLKLTPNVSISHFAFASVMAKPSLIEKLSEMLDLGSKEHPSLSGQVGIETGSSRMVKGHMRGKALPFKPEEWPSVVVEAHKILAENHWVPCSTLVIGLPGERSNDVLKTIELVERLGSFKSLIIPLFFVPIGGLQGERFFGPKDMLPEHWMLMAACMRHNFKWVSELADEYFQRHRLRGLVIKGLILKVMEKKMEPYLRLMERGINPIAEGIAA